ncbi:Meiotically up-regulated gene 1 protein [Candida viswanathii]|uniref:Meiotically up-regulated gene 1 protein n=1 Tax=Candida viswanathii TaxID=5486 RepID=A0A367YNB9_9ASCO|nr:Meiotically up-regulated gene 1 protein [Candida viswanathii]
MDKYSGLPDIDQAGQEVFESSDVESELDLPVEAPAVEGVDNDKIDIEQSKTRFAHSEIIDSSAYDFLGNVSRLNGYHVSRVDETVEEKLSRITRELEEIKLQDDASKTTNQVNQLQDVLNLLKNSQALANGSVLRAECINIDSVFEKVIPPQEPNTRLQNLQNLVALEERLNAIETSLGNDDPTKPLNLTINELSRKIAIIENPEYNFEVIQSEINKLDKELERIEMKKKVLSFDGDDEINPSSAVSTAIKLDDLYEKLPTINKYNAVAPMLLSRLKTLSKVHQDMATTIDLSGSIDQILQDLVLDMKNWDQSITKLNESLTSYEKNFEQNSTSLRERVSDLILKVESLSTD